ncbi:MAG: hypothetical protein IPL36_04690 [Nigerium sp.]|nr:hypothetical protein [Nigerium sp.]
MVDAAVREYIDAHRDEINAGIKAALESGTWAGLLLTRPRLCPWLPRLGPGGPARPRVDLFPRVG